MTAWAAGATVGLLAGTGVVLTVGGAPALRRPRLVDRLAPYLRDTLPASRLLDDSGRVTPFPGFERLFGPALRDAAAWVDRFVGGTASVRRRLDQCGHDRTLEQFRVEQVIYAAVGLLVGVSVGLVPFVDNRRSGAVAVLVLGVAFGLAGGLIRDRLLTAQVTRRQQRMLTEFPTIAELLALSVAAGEGAVAALERVARLSTGELSRELARTLAEARAGASLVAALESMAARTALAPLARFVDGMAIAIERGTPLADVLRAQAVDVREHGKRALLESGGRKEVAMLVPVVFLVLPVTIVFALFPGFYSLSLAVS